MTTAFTKIYGFINTLNDDEVIRATDQNLSKAELEKEKNIDFQNDKGAIHLYVRSGFFSKLRQILTSGTDGAIQKQHIAKELIIKTLENLPEHLKNEKSVERSIENIKNILKNNKLKDFTAGMIRKDLDTINNAFQDKKSFVNPLYENPPLNSLYQGSSKERNTAKSNVSHVVVASNHTAAQNKSVKEDKKKLNTNLVENNIDDDLYQSEYQSDLNAIKVNSAGSNPTELVGVDFEGITVVMLPSDLENFESNTKTNISKNMPLVSSKLANLIPVESAEVILSGSDPAVGGTPMANTISKPTDSTTTRTATLAQNAENVEQAMVELEVPSESTSNHTPSVSSSTTETKSAAKTNPYLASLNTAWDPSDDGYHTITKPFFITGTVTTTSLLAQAYLIPADKELEFTEENKVLNKGNEGRVVQGNHILHKHLETDKTRPTRPFLKLAAISPTKRIHIDNLRGDGLREFKEELKNIYSSSISNIISEHKRLNNGDELESLVIVPMFQDAAKVSDIEINILVEELRTTQKANPSLKIHISANSDNHKKRIQSAYENSFIENT